MKELNIKMPELTGTEKQIAWANDIREDFLANADGLVANAERWEARGDKYSVRYGITEQYTTSSELEGIRERLYIMIAGVSSAAKIIDCRDRLTYEAVKKIAGAELHKNR